MFERFDNRARRALVLAQEEARLLANNFIGPEHILLGILHEGEGVGAHALQSLGITLDEVRQKVRETVGQSGLSSGSPPFTPRAKKVLELALRESLQRADAHIGTEHLLLAIAGERECVASQVLLGLGHHPDEVRQAVEQQLEPGGRTIPVRTRRAMSRLRQSPLGAPVTAFPRAGPAGFALVCSFCGRDVWEVERYLFAGPSVICGDCVAAASAVLAESAPGEREIAFPPRVFGQIPDEGAVAAIATAVGTAFVGGGRREESLAEAIEDYEGLREHLAEAGRRHAVRVRGARLDRVRFDSPDLAEIRFELVLGASSRFTLEGTAVRREGRWLVSRDTMAAVLARGGVVVPPPEPPT